MKIHAVSQASPKDEHRGIRYIHYFSFHGLTTRDGKMTIHAPDVYFSNDVRIPLDCVRNGRYIPEIFAPDSRLIVSEKVKQHLSTYCSCEFLRIRFQKLFEYEFYKPGDFSWYNTEDAIRVENDPDRLVDDLEDIPKYHEAAQHYYEMIEPSLYEIGYGDVPCDAMIELDNVSSIKAEFPAIPKLFEEHPVVTVGSLLLRDDVFKVLEPFINWEYFLKGELEI